MQRTDYRVAVHAATLPSPHPAETIDHPGHSIHALAWGILVLAQEVTRILSRSSEFSRSSYPGNYERGELVLPGTPQILHEVAG